MVYTELGEMSKRYRNGIIEAINKIIDMNIENLSEIILFGSCAKLDIRVGSDIDLLIVTESDITDRLFKSQIIDNLDDLESGIEVDPVFATEDTLRKSEQRLFAYIRKEGIVMWKDGEYTDEYKQLLCPGKK
ncbi:MAG: nucleotidyltransferase domain-containing protein [Clostridiales bacterium]|nr:nucleotidyltransferase domain-containing protein [Clostridiales bacterium]